MGIGKLSDGLAPTPPMGWNSWNRFGVKIDERLVLETAEAIVESGMRDAGYRYVVIDDGWMAPERDRNGDFVADHYGFANPARKNEHLQIPLDLSNFRAATATQARLEARSVHAVIHVRVRENFDKENPTVPTVASA